MNPSHLGHGFLESSRMVCLMGKIPPFTSLGPSAGRLG